MTIGHDDDDDDDDDDDVMMMVIHSHICTTVACQCDKILWLEGFVTVL
jgi:hypothetical protein